MMISYFLQRGNVSRDEKVKLPTVYSLHRSVERLPNINTGGFWVISSNSIGGKLLDRNGGFLVVGSENSALPDLEQVGKIGLRAAACHKLVPMALCLGFNHGTVMQVQGDIVVERLAGLDPEDG